MSFCESYDVILFDLEGTLVDFQWNLKGAAKKIIAELVDAGIDPEQYGPHPDYAKLFNTTRHIATGWKPDIATRFFSRLDLIYDRYDKDALSRWMPYPDTKDTLEKLSFEGYRMGVVSNCGAVASSAVLKRFNLESYFELIISRNDVDYIKPKPDGLIKAAKHFDVSTRKILFIGDSINDILPAKQIDMPSCFLVGGESLVTGKNLHPATHEINCLSDLFGILDKAEP